MPNNVINELNFIGEQKDIDKILSLIHGEEEDQYIDFNKIIPMPDYIYRGDLGQKEQELYGKNNWYDWSNSHWGTKWNAYYQEKKTPSSSTQHGRYLIPYTKSWRKFVTKMM